MANCNGLCQTPCVKCQAQTDMTMLVNGTNAMRDARDHPTHVPDEITAAWYRYLDQRDRG